VIVAYGRVIEISAGVAIPVKGIQPRFTRTRRPSVETNGVSTS
jgi:hypothetical protein